MNQRWCPLLPVQLRPPSIQQIVAQSDGRGINNEASSSLPNTDIPELGLSSPVTATSNSPFTFETDKWRSYHCTTCGRLSSRQYWSQLVCAGRDTSISALPAIVDPPPTSGVQRPPPSINQLKYIRIKTSLHSGRCYTLPEKEARIFHLFPDNLRFADELFREYQTPRMSALLRRNALIRSRRTFSSVVLKLSLKHADIVIMEGDNVQKSFEVCTLFTRVGKVGPERLFGSV